MGDSTEWVDIGRRHLFHSVFTTLQRWLLGSPPAPNCHNRILTTQLPAHLSTPICLSSTGGRPDEKTPPPGLQPAVWAQRPPPWLTHFRDLRTSGLHILISFNFQVFRFGLVDLVFLRTALIHAPLFGRGLFILAKKLYNTTLFVCLGWNYFCIPGHPSFKEKRTYTHCTYKTYSINRQPLNMKHATTMPPGLKRILGEILNEMFSAKTWEIGFSTIPDGQEDH